MKKYVEKKKEREVKLYIKFLLYRGQHMKGEKRQKFSQVYAKYIKNSPYNGKSTQ